MKTPEPVLSPQEERLQAYLDGELSEDEARAVRAEIEADPEAARTLAVFSALGEEMRRAAQAWEAEAETTFEGFSAAVLARLPEEAPRPQVGAGPGLWGRLVTWLAGHPALAAAATILIVLGAGSVLYLDLPGSHPRSPPALELKGAPTEIEDLSFESGSAVVYKTEGQVTVIWISEDGGS